MSIPTRTETPAREPVHHPASPAADPSTSDRADDYQYIDDGAGRLAIAGILLVLAVLAAGLPLVI